MQRLSSGLVVIQTIQEGTFIFCQLPTGEWQLGSDRNTPPIRSVDDIKAFASERTQAIIETSLQEWAERGKRTSQAAQATGRDLAGDRLSGLTPELRQEVEEVIDYYLAIGPALRLQIKGMLQAFVSSMPSPGTVEQPAAAAMPERTLDLPRIGRPAMRTAFEDLYPGDKILREQPISGGVIRHYESGRTVFSPNQNALETQMRNEASAPEPDAAPAYPCTYCQKPYPGEKSRDLHMERCKAKPAPQTEQPAEANQ